MDWVKVALGNRVMTVEPNPRKIRKMESPGTYVTE